MTPEEIAAMKAENEKVKADLEKAKADLEKATKAPPKKEPPAQDNDAGDDEDDLRGKARRQKEEADKKNADTKQIEVALTFDLSVPSFLKENADLLPSAMADIVKQADREKYDTKIERANVIKAAWVQEFFSVQANVDLLTPSQQASLQDYLKLTKAGKEQKAEGVYENLFEPALATLKRVKKAEEVGKARAGLAGESAAGQSALIKKISSLSQEFYLGKKEAA